MTFRVASFGGIQSEPARKNDIFCRWDLFRCCHPPRISTAASSLPAPKVITLPFYEPSCTTQRQADECSRLPRSLRQQRADASECLGLLHGLRNPATAN